MVVDAAGHVSAATGTGSRPDGVVQAQGELAAAPYCDRGAPGRYFRTASIADGGAVQAHHRPQLLMTVNESENEMIGPG